MKKYFLPLEEKDAAGLLKFLAPIIKIAMMVLSVILGLAIIVTSLSSGDAAISLSGILGGLLNVVIGMVLAVLVEALILGFSIIVKNNYKEEKEEVKELEKTDTSVEEN